MATGTRTPGTKSGGGRQQFAFRIDDETRRRLDRLVPVVSQSLGMKVNLSDLVRLAIVALEEKHERRSK